MLDCCGVVPTGNGTDLDIKPSVGGAVAHPPNCFPSCCCEPTVPAETWLNGGVETVKGAWFEPTIGGWLGRGVSFGRLGRPPACDGGGDNSCCNWPWVSGE